MNYLFQQGMMVEQLDTLLSEQEPEVLKSNVQLFYHYITLSSLYKIR